MTGFRYDATIVERFPSVVGAVLVASGVSNGPTSPALAAAFADAQASVRTSIGERPLSELPTLAAWRRVFRSFGVDPTQYRSAAEALIRRVMKQGDLHSINTLVDLANLVSIRHALPIAVFDARAIAGGVEVRLARGDEHWTDLGSSTTDRPEPGEVVFVDAGETVVARRWCWRQSAASAARAETTDILVAIEGHHESARADVAAAAADFEGLLREHVSPATLRLAILDAGNAVFE